MDATDRVYTDLGEALRCVVNHLMPRRHGYIVSVRGPDQHIGGQFVDEGRVFGGPGVGLTLHFAFDADSGKAERHARFLACAERHKFSFVPWQGIPCYAARFGDDIDAAVRTHWLVVSSVFYNADSMAFECIVSDEGDRCGPLDAHRAPPRGIWLD